MSEPETLFAAAAAVLETAAPDAKVAAALKADELRRAGAPLGAAHPPPDRPARPGAPPLVPPGDTPRRRFGSPEGRAILLHAIAHIEFNAIDLAFDMALRFAPAMAEEGLDADAFAADWVRIGGEEARHFRMVDARLAELECRYGDFPAHDGLWEAAETTRHDALARLALAPLILEARGLDVTPEMIKRLKAVGDERSVSVLEVIYREEVGHVACGKRWFDALAAARGLEPEAAFRDLTRRYFPGRLKPPFNHEARANAGLSREFYEPIGNETRV
ncbi:ferritin-like domain-containing protein [Marinicaulis aureus]|uniref:Ferritin-like domain-containing protein n=1 Tax=Hyphococcus aureus TaxID=2666033 RepID=A0ABW1KTR3_9PROT